MLFFVKSGFLITYLLIAKERLFGFIHYICQAWSISTEEQAYLMWPVLLKKFKNHKWLLMIGIVVFYFSVKIILSNKLFLPLPYRAIINEFWMHFNMYSIAIGSIFAVLILNKNNIVNYILNTNFFYIIVFITITLIVIGVRVTYFHYQFYFFLFSIIIVNLMVNSNLKNVLEWKVINYLGKIPSKIYSYYFLVLIPILIFVSSIKLDNNKIYFLIFSITIAISSLSNNYFQTFFLKIKAKFSFIESGKL
jgi:peptidoglycan/LPS O-acetylase OafA/YrhL